MRAPEPDVVPIQATTSWAELLAKFDLPGGNKVELYGIPLRGHHFEFLLAGHIDDSFWSFVCHYGCDVALDLRPE